MTQTPVIRICLVGALAQIAKEHIHAIREVPAFHLGAVCDINGKRLRSAYPELPEDAFYTDYRPAVRDPRIDLVVIATPNGLHFPMAVAALEAGKMVLCEKPVTHDLESARRLASFIDRFNRLFVVSFHFRFFPEVQAFSRERRRFGRVLEFEFFSSEGLDQDKAWTLDREQGGPWLDWAPNALSVLRLILPGGDIFSSFNIGGVKFSGAPGHSIELRAEVELALNNVRGRISVDWLDPKGNLAAKTLLRTESGHAIELNHMANAIFVDGEKYWTGRDCRYIDLYRDLEERIRTGSGNFPAGLQDMEIIQAAREFAVK
jgi:predicted dehydrogenase